MDEYRLRFFAAHAYATQMSLFNSLSSPTSLSQALTAASMQQPSSFTSAGNAATGSGLTAAALSRAWLSSSTDSSDSMNVSGVRSQSPGTDQRPASSPGHQRMMTCPLCGLSLEGPDVSSHFYEEVHKMETFRSTLRFERLNHWGSKDMTSGSSPLALPWPSNGDPLTDHHHHQQPQGQRLPHRSHHHSPYECVDSSVCKRLRFPGDKLQPCSRWQTYQRVRQNRQSRLEAKRQQRESFIGLLRCKRMQHQQRIDEKQEKSSTTSSPQASPTSITGSINNNNIVTSSSNKSNGRIWSIVGEMEQTMRQEQAGRTTWSPEEKEILRDKSMDLSQTIIPDDHHMHSKTLTREVTQPVLGTRRQSTSKLRLFDPR